jgi:hypothetical protein
MSLASIVGSNDGCFWKCHSKTLNCCCHWRVIRKSSREAVKSELLKAICRDIVDPKKCIARGLRESQTAIRACSSCGCYSCGFLVPQSAVLHYSTVCFESEALCCGPATNRQIFTPGISFCRHGSGECARSPFRISS